MSETIDELTIEWTDDDGVVTTKELGREVLTKGQWTTIMFLYQDWDKKSEDYGPSKIRIQRYQKRDGRYMARSKFNISSAAQARKMVDIITEWFPSDDKA